MADGHKTSKKYDLRIALANKKPRRSDTSTLLKKIDKIRETTAFLKSNLELEQHELERARSNIIYPSIPNMVIPLSQSYMIYPEYFGGPAGLVPPYFLGPVPDWRQLALQRQQQQLSSWVPYGYSITLPEAPPRCIKSLIPNDYMLALDNVDRLCRKELVNMQANMRNLRRMTYSWKKFQQRSLSTSSSSESCDYRERRVRRRIKRRAAYKVGDEEDSYY